MSSLCTKCVYSENKYNSSFCVLDISLTQRLDQAHMLTLVTNITDSMGSFIKQQA